MATWTDLGGLAGSRGCLVVALVDVEEGLRGVSARLGRVCQGLGVVLGSLVDGLSEYDAPSSKK